MLSPVKLSLHASQAVVICALLAGVLGGFLCGEYSTGFDCFAGRMTKDRYSANLVPFTAWMLTPWFALVVLALPFFLIVGLASRRRPSLRSLLDLSSGG